MALAGILSTSLGEAAKSGEAALPRVEHVLARLEVSKQSIHSDANRLGLVIGNSSYPDADVSSDANRQRRKAALASTLRK